MRGPEIEFDEALAAEAADWYARLRSENLSEIDAARFRIWLAGDPARRREFEAISGFWDELAVLDDTPEVMAARESIAARRSAGSAEQLPVTLATGRRGVTSRGWWAGAAAMVLAAAALWFVLPFGSDPNRYTTGVGEQRTVPLADGSVVTLNTATEIRLHYSANQRAVELVAGQANFEVAKDATRPFVVSAGGGTVRAVGTVFDVYKSVDQVKVTLIEGKVAVRPGPSAIMAVRDGASVAQLPGSQTITTQSPDLSRPDSAHPGPSYKPSQGGMALPTAPLPAGLRMGSGEIMLVAGEQLIYGGAGTVAEPVATDLQRATAWRARKLDFSDTPLHEAIAEANRYSRDQIVLLAPELRNARISGSFEAGKNEIFAEGLQSYFRLKVEHRTDRSIVLTPSGD